MSARADKVMELCKRLNVVAQQYDIPTAANGFTFCLAAGAANICGNAEDAHELIDISTKAAHEYIDEHFKES